MMKSFALAGVCAIGLMAAPAYAQSASSSSSSAPSASASSPQFVTAQSSKQWRASKLSGVPVYGADNKKIGSIDDILIDSNGQAKVAVIGIGGFLGVGQKNVGVPFASLKFSDQTEGRSAASGSSSSSSSAARTNEGYPASATLNATLQQLQKAPTFQYASATPSSTGAPAVNGLPPAHVAPPANGALPPAANGAAPKK